MVLGGEDMRRVGALGDVLVLGLGMTGSYVARHCAGLLGGRVRSVTLFGGASSAEGPEVEELRAAGVRVVCGSEDVMGRYDLCVASPGIPERSAFFRAAVACSTEVVSEPEFAWRESPSRWVAITGTNGKTTTTTLARDLLRAGGLPATAVGNIGNLATKAADERAEGEWFVAELSSFQLAVSRDLHPRAAALLNVTPDHLAWHGSMEDYAAAKERVFANLTGDDLAVVVRGDAWCAAIEERLRERALRVCAVDVAVDPGGAHAAFVRDGRLVVRLDGAECVLPRAEELQIAGSHNMTNALVAAAMALELGVGADAVSEGLRDFAPLEHRAEPCGELAGVRFVNDSKATNTDAAEKALASFGPGEVVLLAGGHDKGTDLSELARLATTSCAAVVCYGEAGPRLAEAMRVAASEAAAVPGATPMRVEEAPHLAEALDVACGLARSGQTVLLSPACSSFDEFSSFEERGRVFKRLVAERVARAEVA